jgi:hypothetical protein
MTAEINENETLDELLARAHAEENGTGEEATGTEPENDIQDENDPSDPDKVPFESASKEDTSNDVSFSLEDKTFYEERLAEMAEEMEKIAGEALYWQEMAHSSSVYAKEMGADVLFSMKEGAEAQLQAAKLAKKAAYEDDDLDAQVAADANLMKATATLHWLENQPPVSKRAKGSPSQGEPRKPNLNPSRSAPMVEAEIDLHPAVNQWVEKNPWMDELDPRFDSTKATAVVKFATQLERNLTRAGRGYEINSPSYFKRLDNYVREFSQATNAEFVSKSKPQSSVLRPVSTKKDSVSQNLTEAEKDLCKSLGISQKSYLKNREYDRRQQTFKQSNQIYGEIE